MVKFPVRIKCATLSWNTLGQGLDEIEAELELSAPVSPSPSASIDAFGEGEVALGDAAGIVAVHREADLVVHVAELGMMVLALGDQRDHRHEPERLDEVSEP